MVQPIDTSLSSGALSEPTGPPDHSGRALSPDLAEKLIVAVLFAFFLARLLAPGLTGANWLNLLNIASETAVLGFVLTRRAATSISTRVYDWLIGFAGTLFPLLVVPVSGETFAPFALCAALMANGFLFQLWAKFTLRRSFGVVAANRGIKSTGPYRFVRHPMYAGYMVTQLGFLLARPHWWNASVYALAWCIQIARILAEERLLSRDPTYRTLRHSTRYRLLPGIF